MPTEPHCPTCRCGKGRRERFVPPAESVDCPTCGAKSGERCVTTRLLHIHPDPRDLERVGQPTVPHVARVSAELDARHA
jgi:hypothetical protein